MTDVPSKNWIWGERKGETFFDAKTSLAMCYVFTIYGEKLIACLILIKYHENWTKMGSENPSQVIAY